MPSCPSHSTVSAVEMLEANKIIHFPKHIDNYPQSRLPTVLKAMPVRVVPVVRIPSSNSAFRPIHLPPTPPPLPPKSQAIRIRAIRLSSASSSTSPPPLPPRSHANPSDTATAQPGWTPTPKPRLSKMKSLSDLSPSSHSSIPSVFPTPKPRKMSTEVSPTPSPCLLDYKKENLRTTPISRGCSVASVKRRNWAHTRPATPLLVNPDNEQSPPSFPTMDESERQFLEEAVRQTYESSDDESECSAPYSRLIRFPSKPASLPSPTTDSGLPHSDVDDQSSRRPCSAKSEDDGFFDASLAKKEERGGDDSSSEALTSISNTKPVESEAEPEERGRGLSSLEKNARVMRWIHSTASVN